MSSDRNPRKTTVLERAAPAHSERTLDSPAGRIAGVVLGRLAALVNPDSALVVLNGQSSTTPIRARRFCPLAPEDIGKEVALMFEEGDPTRPMIIGRVEMPPGADLTAPSRQPISIDADSVLLTGGREIVLRCGEATLILKRDGKVILRGVYVETQASGVNRIKGGCVKIN